VTVAAKVGTVQSGRDREGRVRPRKPKESGWRERESWERFRLQEEYRMCLIFAMTGASGQGKWVKGSVAPVLASELPCCSFPGSPTWPGAH